jgi:hypothetical protein
MLHHRRIQRETAEVVRLTCNKCGRSWEKAAGHPDFTTIKNTYGYGSPKDTDKYLSHICEECMDAFYATFAIPPEVVSMIVWGEESPDPVHFLDDPQGATTSTPVMPAAVEEHAPQEEAT